MVDVAGAKPTMSFFEQSEDAGGIVSRINAMAADVNEKMFGRTTVADAGAGAAAAAPPPQAAQPAPADPPAHPEKMLKQSPGGRRVGVAVRPSDESAREFSPQFWKSATYKLAFNGIALGDVDGDGKIETVIITPDKVIVYRYEQQRFYQVTEYETDSQGINIGVDVADINGNGVPEIIVTSLTLTRKALASSCSSGTARPSSGLSIMPPGISGSATFPIAARSCSARSPVRQPLQGHDLRDDLAQRPI